MRILYQVESRYDEEPIERLAAWTYEKTDGQGAEGLVSVFLVS